MALTKNIQPTYELDDINEMALAASSTVYLGSAVGQVATTQTCRALVAADKFLGFAIDQYSDTLDTGNARFKTKGMRELTVTGLASTTAIGTSVYASDDNTYTLTSTSNSLIGKVHRVLPGATKAIVRFDADLI
jgi:hypothetical protein